jgi:hypothetical protein
LRQPSRRYLHRSIWLRFAFGDYQLKGYLLSAAEALVGLVANGTAEFDSMEQLLGTFIPLADALKILCYERVARHRGLSFES